MAQLTKVEGQRVTISKQENVPTVSGAQHSAIANQSVPALQATSQKWVPPRGLKDAEKSTDVVFRKVRGILNKLTPEKFDKLTKELLHVGINTKFILKGIILLVFEKALDEPKYSSLYAQLCLCFSKHAPNFDDPNKAGHSTFRRLLLKQCEEEYNSRSKASAALDKKDGVLSTEEEEQRGTIKRKMLGNIKFIGELGKLGLLHEAILHKCIKQLLDKKKRATLADISEDMECLCYLMKTVGSQLDVAKAKPLMDQYFDRVCHILDNTDLPCRIQFMLQDILELRNNKWVPRRGGQENSAPKPIQEIRQEAWQKQGRHLHSDRRMIYPGDPNFLYGRDKRAQVTRGFDDVFMTDSNFESFLPVDDFGHLSMNNNPFASHAYASRFAEPPRMRPALQEDDSYFSPKLSRSSPPDFMPSYQAKKSQPQTDARARRITTKSQRPNQDGEISLRPARESIVAQGTQPRKQNKPTTGSSDPARSPVLPDKSKQAKKAATSSKVEKDKEIETIVEEFFTSKDVIGTTKKIKEKNSQQLTETVMVKILENNVKKLNEKNESNLIEELMSSLLQEQLITQENVAKVVSLLIKGLGPLPDERMKTREFLAKFLAQMIIKEILDLKTVFKTIEPLHLLFLQCLVEVKSAKSENWLLNLYEKSKINLMSNLPEEDRNNEKLAEILQKEGLIFLAPLLKAQIDFYEQIKREPTSAASYKWLKDNINEELFFGSEFIKVLTTCVLKYVTLESSLAPDVDRSQTVEKNIQDSEKITMENFEPLLQKFLNDNVELQVSALYALQVFCHQNNFPKGLLLRMFMMLYDFEIIEEDAFLTWKEDVSDELPGKGKSLFQVNAWLTWLETAAEESSGSEPE